MSLDTTPLTFGQYQGDTPEKVADTDPGYIVWAYQTLMPKVCSRTLYLACIDAMSEQEPE